MGAILTILAWIGGAVAIIAMVMVFVLVWECWKWSRSD